MHALNVSGKFIVRILNDGNIRFEEEFSNGIVDIGKNTILDTMFNSEGQSSWYCGLIGSLSVLSNNDIMASHSGWTEYTLYDEAARLEWIPDAAASKSLENPQTDYMEFTINDASEPTLPGIFICDTSTKGGATGILWSTGQFTNPPTVADDEVVQVQYKVSIN